MTRTQPTDPTAEVPPVPRRVARAAVPGEPGPPRLPAVGGQGGITSRLATPPPGGAPPSPLQSRERAVAGKPEPAAGAAPDGRAAPGRGRAQAPAGASGTPDSPPAGTSGEQRAAQRDAWKRAQSGLKHQQRAQKGRYTRVADRGVTARLKPGMARRAPLLDERTGEAP